MFEARGHERAAGRIRRVVTRIPRRARCQTADVHRRVERERGIQRLRVEGAVALEAQAMRERQPAPTAALFPCRRCPIGDERNRAALLTRSLQRQRRLHLAAEEGQQPLRKSRPSRERFSCLRSRADGNGASEQGASRPSRLKARNEITSLYVLFRPLFRHLEAVT